MAQSGITNPGRPDTTGNGDPEMRTRHALPLIATAVTALVIGSGTAGAVLAASPGTHAAHSQTTTAPHDGIQLDAHFVCNPILTTCPR
jgi:hypothetical protein